MTHKKRVSEVYASLTRMQKTCVSFSQYDYSLPFNNGTLKAEIMLGGRP